MNNIIAQTKQEIVCSISDAIKNIGNYLEVSDELIKKHVRLRLKLRSPKKNLMVIFRPMQQ